MEKTKEWEKERRKGEERVDRPIRHNGGEFRSRQGRHNVSQPRGRE